MTKNEKFYDDEIYAKLTLDEFRIAQEKADYYSSGNISELFRQLLHDGFIVTYNSELISQVLYEFNRISNNINQIYQCSKEKNNGVNIQKFKTLINDYDTLFGLYMHYIYNDN